MNKPLRPSILGKTLRVLAAGQLASELPLPSMHALYGLHHTVCEAWCFTTRQLVHE